ncbi:MAG TPA: HNH endonuclease [Trichocoleus sp.]|jgi:5-methylcytosine-specific restriction endonuclease McrA
MAKNTSQFTIKAEDLAKALEISLDRLYEIVEFFDKDSKDEWDLVENEHFIFLSKNKGTRLFSQIGAFAIAKYMDTIEKKTLLGRLVEFITRHKEKLRNAFVRQRVYENCSSLTHRNSFSFLSRKDVVNILCTSYARLDKAFETIQKSDPMENGKHFIDIEGKRFYSLSGIEKLSRELSNNLKKPDRREWCKAVHIVGNKTLAQIISAEEQREKRITAAKNTAKKRDKCCQITGSKPKPSNQVELAAHHIFSKEEYPHLSESLDNLITLTNDVHKEFHHWNGGFDKPCTVDEFIRFVSEQYSDEDKCPNLDELLQKLHRVKQLFGFRKVA